MKAVVHVGCGSADVLELRELDRPVAADDDVLMRVHAASLAAGDSFGRRGVPFPIRMFVGFPKPKKDHVVGADLAGRVEAVGRNVTRFKPGEEVFGECSRACADYTCAEEDKLVHKPHDLTFEQAAAVPTSALTDKPVLIARGMKDTAFREKDLRRWEAAFPRARTVGLPSLGHFVQEEAPDELARLVGAFLRETTVAAAAG